MKEKFKPLTKVRIKPYHEIMKTFTTVNIAYDVDWYIPGVTNGVLFFPEMKKCCGKVVAMSPTYLSVLSEREVYSSPDCPYLWHRDWFEILDKRPRRKR
jgi:hypothetical protein